MKSIFVFGSILTNRFKSRSDIDLIVEFQGIGLYEYANNYFDFKESLEKQLNRKVDILEEKSIKNPTSKKNIDTSKLLINK